MLYAALDGTVRCDACGESAQFDVFSRWVLCCAVALLLPMLLLNGDVFFSGHLFVVAMFLIFVAWRLLSMLALPILALEPVERRASLNRTESVFVAIVLLVGALAFDGFMASRIAADAAKEKSRVTEVRNDR